MSTTFSDAVEQEGENYIQQLLAQNESNIKQKIDESTGTIKEELQNTRRAATMGMKLHSMDCKQRHNEQMEKSSSIEEKQDLSLEKSDKILSTLERIDKRLDNLEQSDLDALNSTKASDNMKALQDKQYDVSAVPEEILTNDNASETTGNNSSVLSSSYQPEKVKTEDTVTVSTASTAVASFTSFTEDEGKENACNHNTSRSVTVASSALQPKDFRTPSKEKYKGGVNSSFGHKTPSSSAQGRRLGLGARPPPSSQRAREAKEKYLSARKKRINQELDEKKLKEKGRPMPKA
jgi:hypothetical protein